MNTTTEFNELLSLADKIIASTLNPDLIALLEDYSNRFNDWYNAYQASVSHHKSINNKEDLERLLVKHEKVLDLSEKLKDSMPSEMAKLKQKGKGILAYTDLLPKKISLSKTQKG